MQFAGLELFEIELLYSRSLAPLSPFFTVLVKLAFKDLQVFPVKLVRCTVSATARLTGLTLHM